MLKDRVMNRNLVVIAIVKKNFCNITNDKEKGVKVKTKRRRNNLMESNTPNNLPFLFNDELHLEFIFYFLIKC